MTREEEVMLLRAQLDDTLASFVVVVSDYAADAPSLRDAKLAEVKAAKTALDQLCLLAEAAR